MADAYKVTAERLIRLRPSDLDRIQVRLTSDDTFKYSLLDLYCSLLASSSKPSAVELDDVVKIALQLESIGFWEQISPEAFLSFFRPFFATSVVSALAEVLDVDESKNTIDQTQIDEFAKLAAKLRPKQPPRQAEKSIKHQRVMLNYARLSQRPKKKVGTVTFISPQKVYGIVEVEGGGPNIVKRRNEPGGFKIEYLEVGQSVKLDMFGTDASKKVEYVKFRGRSGKPTPAKRKIAKRKQFKARKAITRKLHPSSKV